MLGFTIQFTNNFNDYEIKEKYCNQEITIILKLLYIRSQVDYLKGHRINLGGWFGNL